MYENAEFICQFVYLYTYKTNVTLDVEVYSQLWSISVRVSTAASSALSNPASDARALTATFNAFRQETALASDSNDIFKEFKKEKKVSNQNLWKSPSFYL